MRESQIEREGETEKEMGERERAKDIEKGRESQRTRERGDKDRKSQKERERERLLLLRQSDTQRGTLHWSMRVGLQHHSTQTASREQQHGKHGTSGRCL